MGRKSLWIASVLVLANCATALAGKQADSARPSTLKCLGERATRLVGQLPEPAKNLTQWHHRREAVKATLTSVLGLPDREPMRAQVKKVRQEDDLTIEDVIYLWGERAYVTANVVRPTNVDGPLPAIVSPPGWKGHLAQDYYHPWAYHMARKGYLILFIDDPHVKERQAACAGLYGIASAAGTPVMGIQVFDTLRGLDYLLTRPDVDPARIGISGLCQGSEQTWLAAALEERFRVVAPVCGTTTYECWARMPGTGGILSDPSPYVENLLLHTEWDEINACIAPRPLLIASNSGDNWWPKPGFDAVVERLRQAYSFYGIADNFDFVWDLRSHSMTPFIPELDAWFEKHLKPLPKGTAVRRPCGQPIDPDTSMIRYFQRRIARQADALPRSFASAKTWQAYRGSIVGWLRGACAVDELPRQTKATSPENSLAKKERASVIELVQADGLICPALWYPAAQPRQSSAPVVVLSASSSSCAADSTVQEFIATCNEAGWSVMVPEHATSIHPKNLRQSSKRNVYLGPLYGVGDMVGLAPLAQRVWDNLACVDYLASQKASAPAKIVLLGMGIGGLDAALAGALDSRVDAVASIGATTFQAWAEHVALEAEKFDTVLPYLPGLTTQTDLQYLYAALSPRPLLLIDAADRSQWPASGFDRVRNVTTTVYNLLDARSSLTAVPAEPSGSIQAVGDWLQTLRRR